MQNEIVKGSCEFQWKNETESYFKYQSKHEQKYHFDVIRCDRSFLLTDK